MSGAFSWSSFCWAHAAILVILSPLSLRTSSPSQMASAASCIHYSFTISSASYSCPAFALSTLFDMCAWGIITLIAVVIVIRRRIIETNKKGAP